MSGFLRGPEGSPLLPQLKKSDGSSIYSSSAEKNVLIGIQFNGVCGVCVCAWFNVTVYVCVWVHNHSARRGPLL